jgi:tRNA pseudouridine55 synthase
MTATSSPPAESGLIVVDKPAGWTSHQVVGRVRRLMGTRKVGHAGTLDPMATGVLVVGVNRATRLLGHLILSDKAYAATIRLGVTTVTDDAEGEVVAATGVTGLADAALATAVTALTGPIQQIPSAVSAIKVNGVRSYARVRAGQDVTLVARPVVVNRFEVVGRREESAEGVPVLDLDVLVECTTGTYVRALARDLGAALGIGGHLTALRRTQVGPFTLAEAQTLDPDATGLAVMGLPEVVRRCFATLILDDEQTAAVRFGRALPGLVLPAPRSALLSGAGDFLALYRQEPSRAVPEAVFV